MNQIARLGIVVFSAGSFTLSALGLGHEGHEAVGILATQKLQADSLKGVTGAQAALAHIKQLLGDENLGTGAAASWADYVRIGEPDQLVAAGFIQEQKDAPAYIKTINSQFPGNGNWHFCDLPLDADAYADGLPGTNDDDVIKGFSKCIEMLESADTSAAKNRHECALRFLVHLVGDIHQPFHVACGYYKVNSDQIVTDPAKAKGLPDDRGANQLLTRPTIPHPGGRPDRDELHATWDSALVWAIAGRKSSVAPQKVADALKPSFTVNYLTPETGDYHKWPSDWAKDSLVLARKAMAGIKVPVIKDTKTASDGHFEIDDVLMVGFNKDDYVKDHLPEMRDQILKASFRLAELLEHIKWAQ